MASDTVRDVVIGMSDGLTVPFALAAGLSDAIAVSPDRHGGARRSGNSNDARGRARGGTRVFEGFGLTLEESERVARILSPTWRPTSPDTAAAFCGGYFKESHTRGKCANAFANCRSAGRSGPA